MVSWPTGPQPKIATVEPGWMFAMSAPKYAVGRMSLSRIASSSSMASGSFTRLMWAKGTRAFSACRPAKPPALSGPP